MRKKWKLNLNLILVILLWSSIVNACPKISPIIPKQNGYSVSQIRVLWEACSHALRNINPILPQDFVRLNCDCSTDFTVKKYNMSELTSMHDNASKMKEFQTLIQLNCNEYRYGRN